MWRRGGKEAVTAYVRACGELGAQVDPSVATSLLTEWSVVKASNEFSLLPLLLVVDAERREADGNKEADEKREAAEERARKSVSRVRRKASSDAIDAPAPSQPFYFFEHLTTLRLKAGEKGRSHLADANARVIALLLARCPNIKSVDLRAVGLSAAGARELVDAVRVNRSMATLNLSDNPGIKPAVEDGALARALAANEGALTLLDVTNDQLGFSAVDGLRRAMKQVHCRCGTHFELLDEGNNVFEEVLNALTHGVGVLFALGGSFVLMYHASAEGQSRRTFYACLIYCSSLVLLFTASTALHAAFMYQRASTVLGLFDHTAIYFLIAGSYTPFCLISLESHEYGVPLTIAQWVLALFGVVFCLVDHRVSLPFKVPIELSLYLGMGWMLGFVWSDVAPLISEGALELLSAGGLAYTGGVVFFVLEKTHHPIGHVLWHCAVLVGAICHYFSILLFVVGIEEGNVVGQCADLTAKA
jgi:hemolysin III